MDQKKLPLFTKKPAREFFYIIESSIFYTYLLEAIYIVRINILDSLYNNGWSEMTITGDIIKGKY